MDDHALTTYLRLMSNGFEHDQRHLNELTLVVQKQLCLDVVTRLEKILKEDEMLLYRAVRNALDQFIQGRWDSDRMYVQAEGVHERVVIMQRYNHVHNASNFALWAVEQAMLPQPGWPTINTCTLACFAHQEWGKARDMSPWGIGGLFQAVDEYESQADRLEALWLARMWGVTDIV